MYNPLVTIIIPVYNGSNFVKQAIESALKQTYKNIEVFVVNDGSNDEGETEKIISEYADKIIYISKKNGGVSSALNTAILNMKGEWISWLSHDDLYKNDKIQKQINFLNNLLVNNNSIVFDKVAIFSAIDCINVSGKKIREIKYNFINNTSPIDRLIENIQSYRINGCSVLMNKKSVLNVGLFDEKIKTVSDVDMWYKLMLNGVYFYYINDILVSSRHHKQQVGVKLNDVFSKEYPELISNTVERLLNYGISKKQKYKLVNGLRKSGFQKISNKINNDLKMNSEYSIIYDTFSFLFWNSFYYSRCIIRFFYRLITVK